jgi:hypothetical protein
MLRCRRRSEDCRCARNRARARCQASLWEKRAFTCCNRIAFAKTHLGRKFRSHLCLGGQSEYYASDRRPGWAAYLNHLIANRRFHVCLRHAAGDALSALPFVLQRPLEQFVGAVCGAKKKGQGEVKMMLSGDDSIPKSSPNPKPRRVCMWLSLRS